jgi:phosphatidylinositol glycan class N
MFTPSFADHELQLFKILSPFVFLSAAFATLNARLGMPPFALFLVALGLTDGALTCLFVSDCRCNMLTPSRVVMTMTFFFNVTDRGKKSGAQCVQIYLYNYYLFFYA